MPSSTRRVVIDTNIWFSAYIRQGTPLALIEGLPSAGFICISSPVLIAELSATLLRKSGWPAERIVSAIDAMTARCLLVQPTLTVNVCRDPDDDRFLECAAEGRADFIVSGDKDLLSLGAFNDIPILTVRQFLDLNVNSSERLS